MGKDRKRSRSRDRDRKRSRSRSPKRDRKRSRSRDKDRRKKERSPRRSRSRSPRRAERRRSRSRDRRRDDKDRRDVDYDRKKEEERAAAEEEKQKNAEKEKEQRELEKKIEERRAKVAEWRERQRRLKLESGVVEAAPEEEEKKKEEVAAEPSSEAATAKPWSLEDEDDDDETTPAAAETTENGTVEKNGVVKAEEKMEVDEEVDPLDAFMDEVAQKMKKSRPATARIVTINTAPTEEKNKGEILENEGRAEVVIDDIDLETAAQSLCHKARLLNEADHTRIYYRPFTKNFYVESQEIAKMTKNEVKALRKQLDDIRIKGKGTLPKPIKTWAQCGCSRVILNQLKKLGYEKPTPIQAQAIPAVMAGRDVIGIAQTGSGKTLAFLLPMFRHIMDQDPLEDMDGPIALIMAPTRELCMQTWKEANKFAKVLNLRVVCAYGGVGISEQIADLKRGAEIIVATPGRFIDLLVSNNGRVTNLRRVTYLVLDEADRMFDMGFEPQVMKIISNIRPDRQTVLFSATFPRIMEALAQKVLQEPVEILVGGKSVVCADVTQNVVICEEHQKALKLLELLGIYYEMGNTIVFVDRQEKADEICGMLLASHYACAPLHGGIDQADRDSNIVDFKNGSVKILVATSVAARGLDVKNLLLVVNYDCPNHYEDYVHRCGRTGRAGNKGYAYTFVLPVHQEKMAGEICRAFETAGAKPPPELKAMFDKFVAEMKEQGKEVHLGGDKGFKGSGYKHDDEEAESEASKKMMSRLILNIEHGQADDDELEEQLTSMLKTKRVTSGGPKKERMTEKVQDKVAAAKAAAAAIQATLNVQTPAPEKDATSRAAEAVMRGAAIAPLEVTPEMRARQAANKLNEKLNYMGGEAPKINMGDDWEYYEEEMDINDFPQQVRYKICSRESVGQIAEFADVGLSVRGTHYPSGREPKQGDRRLHLLIEARSEHALRRAKDEIIRIMKDSLRQLSQGPRGGMQARYRV